MRSRYTDSSPLRTLDGSLVRELMHPGRHGNRNQSLAEALVEPGSATRLHRHRLSEELYHIVRGEGRMTLGLRSFMVSEGDTVHIPPGTAHNIRNTGSQGLRFPCACSPAYAHADTELLD